MHTFFNGTQIFGVWRLVIYSFNRSIPVQISSWSMSFQPGAFLKSNESATYGSTITLKENAVSEQLKIAVNAQNYESLKLDIVDSLGRLVKSESLLKGMKDYNMDATFLQKGTYLLIPTLNGNRTVPIKFIKK